MRRTNSSIRKLCFYLGIFTVFLFASVAFVQFNHKNHGQGTVLSSWYDGKKLLSDLRNEVEEVGANENSIKKAVVPAPRKPSADGSKHYDADEDSAEKPLEFLKELPTTKPLKTCPHPAGNRKKEDFDVSEMAYTLKKSQLNWDGDIGIWDEKIEQRFQKAWATNDSTESKRQLQVFLVPFSHSDPGWLMTVDQYLLTYTKSTLDLMLQRLQQWQDMTFVWAEISFFKLWWDKLNVTQQNDVRNLVQQGRLEFLNGGYVMPDEANCHYYAIIHQYVYGHQWLMDNLNITPRHGFSIDPFGYSSTMPYLLKNLGFQSMYIQRIHYAIRKILVHAKSAQFSWQQPWDVDNEEAMFCYMSHNTLYDLKHTLGVDPNICVQFDFQYQQLMEATEASRMANLLLEQFRKFAFLFPHDVILVPIGMDFRWSNTFEWDSKYGNFHLMMDILNKNKSNNINIRWGTYSQYYDEVFKQMGEPNEWKSLPSIVGDFFPYADRNLDYWTGYFTSHPYQKALSRQLERTLRVAELLYSLTQIRNIKLDDQILVKYLDTAAQSLGLFQHHDAITGTSKQIVSDDYEQRLRSGHHLTNIVISHIASVMFWPTDIQHPPFQVNHMIPTEKALLQQQLIEATFGHVNVVLFNSLASYHQTLVDLYVDTEFLIIEDQKGTSIPYQTSTYLDPQNSTGAVLAGGKRVTFMANFNSIGFQTYVVRGMDNITAKHNGYSSTKVNTTEDLKKQRTIILKNSHFQAEFSSTTGLLQSITGSDGIKRTVRLEFKRYETIASGAYLFIPNGIADIVAYPHEIRLLEGELYSELHVIMPGYLQHVVRIIHDDGDMGRFLHIENTVNLNTTEHANMEAVMRFSTELKNNMTFYTDSNAFQMIRRKASHDLPLQANYFPATNMAFLQDETARLTMHLEKAHGVGSQDEGQIEVMMERMLEQDDARGVEEVLKDQRITKTTVRLQLETQGFCRTCQKNEPKPTSLANRINLDLNYPLTILSSKVLPNESSAPSTLTSLTDPLPCNTHLVMLKPIKPGKTASDLGMILHNLASDCDNDNSSSAAELILKPDQNTVSQSCVKSDTLSLAAFFKVPSLVPFSYGKLNFLKDTKKLTNETDVVRLEHHKLVSIIFHV